jgi:hypothetical protein
VPITEKQLAANQANAANCLDLALNDNGTAVAPMSRDLAGDGRLVARYRNHPCPEPVAVPLLSGPGRTPLPPRSKHFGPNYQTNPFWRSNPKKTKPLVSRRTNPPEPVAAQPSRARQQAVRPPRWGSAMRCPVRPRHPGPVVFRRYPRFSPLTAGLSRHIVFVGSRKALAGGERTQPRQPTSCRRAIGKRIRVVSPQSGFPSYLAVTGDSCTAER